MKISGTNGFSALLVSVAFSLAAAGSARAATYDLTASGGTVPGLGAPGYGTVNVTTVGSDLEFNISLAPNMLVDTGTHSAIEFDLATSGLTISSTPGTFTALPTPFSQATGSSFTNSGFNDPVNYALQCGGTGHGVNSCGDVSSLTFYVLGAGALSPEQIDGVYLTADIYDQATGQTGTVGAVPSAPIPTALPLFATGLAVIGLLSWRRKRQARTLVAA